MEAGLPKFATRVCRTHGRTEFVLEGRGYYRCKACRMQRVMDWRRRAKARLIAEAGGCCQICGYDRYGGALHFHHVDPAKKEFGLARKGFTRSFEKMRAEAAKCVCCARIAMPRWRLESLRFRRQLEGDVPQIDSPG